MQKSIEQCALPTNPAELLRRFEDLYQRLEIERKEHFEQVLELKRQIKSLQRQLFGSSSEKIETLLFPNTDLADSQAEGERQCDNSGIEESEDAEPAIKTPRRKRNQLFGPNVEHRRIEHDVDSAKKACPDDSSTLVKIGEETRVQVEYIPAKVVVLEHVYPKYACPSCKTHVVMATKAHDPSILPTVTNQFLAHVVAAKYLDHLPCYRISKMFKRLGYRLGRASLINWIIKVSDQLKPLVKILEEDLTSGTYLQCDETHLKVLQTKSGETNKTGYLWVLRSHGKGPPIVLYHFAPTRSSKIPAKLFAEAEGYLQVDGYAGYDALFRNNPKLTRISCMAHIRRKFFEFHLTLSDQAKANHRVNDVLRLIQQAYAIEEKIRDKSADERLYTRQTEAANVYEQLLSLIMNDLPLASKNSGYGKALDYAAKELPLLRPYLSRPEINIDNLPTERAIRPVALGRRNWLFSASEIGAETSANLCSLLYTAEANGLNPEHYLLNALNGIKACNTLEDYLKLLPYNLDI